MSDIKEKIEMELKPFEMMCETTTDHLKDLINGSCEADAQEILSVAKVLGEITDIKKDIVEMCYKKQILEAMEESEYGTDYNYAGRKAYAEPYRHGKMMPDDDDWYNNRDMDYPKKMYYTDTNRMNNSQNSSNNTKDIREGMSGEMRKHYMESKEIHGKDSDEMETLEEFLNTLDSDMTQLYPNMTQSEKTMTRNKLSTMMNKIK